MRPASSNGTWSRWSVADVIDHATAATASLFEQRGLRLIKDVEPGLAAVTGDRDRLIQVVINLISNAVKFTDTGSITCRAVRRGSEIVVSVIDTGLGIAPADQPKVFERFKQVGDTLTDKPKGTGLGLPICREIVEHHGGRIWVESEPGQGSTFSFSLPLRSAATGRRRRRRWSSARSSASSASRSSSRRRARPSASRASWSWTMTPNIRELLMQELTEAGYRVPAPRTAARLIASSGASGRTWSCST